MREFWKKNKILFIFVIALFLLMPSTFNVPSISDSHMIVIGLGIDLSEEGKYEVSIQMVVPKQNSGFKSNVKIVSAEDDTISKGFNKLSLHFGKKLALGQCEYILFNERATEKNIVELLDPIFRESYVSDSCLLFTTGDSANELMKLSSDIQDEYSYNLTTLLEYNEKRNYSSEINLKKLYKSYFSPNNCFVIPKIEIKDKSTDGIDTTNTSSGQSSGSSESGSSDSSSGGGESSSENKVISNDGQLIIMKNSTKLTEVSTDELKGVEWIFGEALELDIDIKDFSDDFYENADIGLRTEQRSVSSSVYFEDDKPVLDITILMLVKITHIEQPNQPIELYDSTFNYLTESLGQAIREKVVTEINDTKAFLTGMYADLFDIYGRFNKYEYKKWGDFLATLENPDDYLSEYVLKTNIILNKIH